MSNPALGQQPILTNSHQFEAHELSVIAVALHAQLRDLTANVEIYRNASRITGEGLDLVADAEQEIVDLVALLAKVRA